MSGSPGGGRSKGKKPSPEQMARLAAGAARDSKAIDVVAIDVSGLLDYTDYLIISSGRSTRQTQAIADNVLRAIASTGKKAAGVEGEKQGNWILIDWGQVIIHVFHQPVREFYELEKLWGDAKRLALPDD